jgi:hypothetical protein
MTIMVMIATAMAAMVITKAGQAATVSAPACRPCR